MRFKTNIKKLLLIFSIICITASDNKYEVTYADNIATQKQFFLRYNDTNYYLKESGKKFGIYDENNNEILPCIFDKIIKDGYNGFISVTQNNKQGLYYKTHEVISPIYEEITRKQSMNYSILYLCLKQNEKIDIKYFDYKNEQMYNLANDCAGVGFKQQHWVYKDNIFYIPIKKNNRFGLISFDTQTFEVNEILPFEYEDMRYFFYKTKKKKSEYEYLCVKKDGKYFLLNFEDFKPTSDFSYDDVETLKGTKFLKVKNNDKYALYDTSKNTNGDFIYDNIIYQINHETPVVYVIKNHKWKNINRGKLVLHNVKNVGKTILFIPLGVSCIAIPPLGFGVFMGLEDMDMFKYRYTFVEY